MADLSGSWLGTYWQHDQPTRFEMTLVQSGNSLSGSILDDSFLGEAHLAGTVVGRSINFTKRYVLSSSHPIDYSGTLSEDDVLLHGSWVIEVGFAGRWEARRSGEDLVADLKRRQSEPILVGNSQ